jgi:hypothetical protein
MVIDDVVSNVKVYGLNQSIIASKYPFAVDIGKCNAEVTKTVTKLAQAPKGSGEDTFLHGIIVQFDLTLPIKVWTEAERYHFLEFVSSQSTMHKIMDFDIDSQCCEYVHPEIVDILKKLVAKYKETKSKDIRKQILYSVPVGFKLTARMTTNYQQLKTIYAQRKNHELEEWRVFCQWIETLPYAEFITGKDAL